MNRFSKKERVRVFWCLSVRPWKTFAVSVAIIRCSGRSEVAYHSPSGSGGRICVVDEVGFTAPPFERRNIYGRILLLRRLNGVTGSIMIHGPH